MAAQPSVELLDRTGDATLDRAIDEFVARGYYLVDPYGPKRSLRNRRPLRELLDPAVAHGKCVELAVQFNEFLRSRGIRPLQPEDASDTSPAVRHPDELGYDDRRLPGLDGHCLTVVTWHGSTWSIDFTAGQYGYQELPLVQRWDETFGCWSRDRSRPATDSPRLVSLRKPQKSAPVAA